MVICGLSSGLSSRSASSRSRPPAFSPVRLRARRDGWSPERQCAFFAALYATGCVARAARSVGCSRESAYRLRARAGAESFAQAWDHVLAGPVDPGSPPERFRQVVDWRKVTLEQLHWRVETGLWRPVLYRGRMTAIARKPYNSALLRLLSRLDKQVAGAKATGA